MTKVHVTIDGLEFEFDVQQAGANRNEFTVRTGDEVIPVYVPDPSDLANLEWLVIDSRPYEVTFDTELTRMRTFSGLHHIEVRDLDAAVSRPVSGDGRVKAPIPGLIAQILVEPGQVVEAGQPILVLEAMKMENEIRASRAGTVQRIRTEPGKTVVLGELLIEIE
jgi:biotin carboxyl carrier protein